LSKVETLVKNAGGKIIKTDNWGKRKLAYPIKKQEFAVYVYFDLELESESVAKLDSNLNITDEVIRHLLTLHIEPPEEDEKDDKKGEEK